MSNIEIKKTHLPDNVKDLARFVLIGREQLVAVRASIRAMDSVGLAKDVREQKKGEAQMMAEALLDAEVRLGELFKKMEKGSGGDRKTEESRIKGNSGVTFETKTKALAELGFTKMDASRFETLAENKDLVAKAKAEAKANDDLVTRSEVLRLAKENSVGNAIEKRKTQIENNLKSKLKNTPKIYQNDAMEFIKNIEPYDLMLTDPPYMTDVDDIKSFAKWIIPALKKMKTTGRAYVFVGAYPEEINAYLSIAMPKQILIWEYKNTLGQNPKDRYKQNYQAILYYAGQDAGDLNIDMTSEQWAVMEVNAPDGRLGDRYHAWQKPIELGERFISHSTKEGDTVIDPFCCTGTFLLAASKANRISKGCDISKKNLSIAIERGCEYGE